MCVRSVSPEECLLLLLLLHLKPLLSFSLFVVDSCGSKFKSISRSACNECQTYPSNISVRGLMVNLGSPSVGWWGRWDELMLTCASHWKQHNVKCVCHSKTRRLGLMHWNKWMVHSLSLSLSFFGLDWMFYWIDNADTLLHKSIKLCICILER